MKNKGVTREYPFEIAAFFVCISQDCPFFTKKPPFIARTLM